MLNTNAYLYISIYAKHQLMIMLHIGETSSSVMKILIRNRNSLHKMAFYEKHCASSILKYSSREYKKNRLKQF